MVFDSGDQISEGALNLFRLCLKAAGQLIPRTAEIYNEWVMDKLNEPDNRMISKEVDEPSIGRFETCCEEYDSEQRQFVQPLGSSTNARMVSFERR